MQLRPPPSWHATSPACAELNAKERDDQLLGTQCCGVILFSSLFGSGPWHSCCRHDQDSLLMGIALPFLASIAMLATLQVSAKISGQILSLVSPESSQTAILSAYIAMVVVRMATTALITAGCIALNLFGGGWLQTLAMALLVTAMIGQQAHQIWLLRPRLLIPQAV